MYLFHNGSSNAGRNTVGLEQWHSHWRVKGGIPLSPKILPKIGKNLEKSGKKENKSGKKRKNWEENKGKNSEGSFTLPFLTDRVGYATGLVGVKEGIALNIKIHICACAICLIMNSINNSQLCIRL